MSASLVGSEMCIRDRRRTARETASGALLEAISDAFRCCPTLSCSLQRAYSAGKHTRNCLERPPGWGKAF
eukprot:15229458-Alexandrium_andersonii.AAC.1